MSTERLEFFVEKLGRALDRLDEALAEPGEGIVIDATIQRFEFTFELLWKTLKRALEEAGRRPSGTPRDVLSFGWQDDWLDGDERLWIGMLADRNRTAHVYDEAEALEIYGRIRDYAPRLRRAFVDVCRRFRLAPLGPSEVREPRVRYRKTAAKRRARS
jgi:nucleotidyltransferase substrate binding protein (TIGR01987 family)